MLEKNRFDKILKVLRKGSSGIEKIHRSDGGSFETLYYDLKLLTEAGLIKKEKTGNRNEKLYHLVKWKTPQEKINLRESRKMLDLLRWWETNITHNEAKFGVILEEIKLYDRISSDHNNLVDHLIEANLTSLHMQNQNTHSIMAQKKAFPLISKELKKQMTARNELIQKYYSMIGSFNIVHQGNVLRWVAETLYFADKRASDNLKNAEQEYSKWAEKNVYKKTTN